MSDEYHYPCVLHGEKKDTIMVQNADERQAAYDLGYKDSPVDFMKAAPKPVKKVSKEDLKKKKLAEKVAENKKKKEEEKKEAKK